MRAENITSSFLVLFIGVTIFILAETQSAIVESNGRADDGSRKSEESNLDHAMSSNSFDGGEESSSLKFEKRRIGSEFLGKRTVPNLHMYLKRKALGSEFLGKRKLGSEFLGKRGFNIEKQQPEDYQFYYSNIPEEEEDYNNGLAALKNSAFRFNPTITSNDHPLSSTSGLDDPSYDEQQQAAAAWNKMQILKRGLGSEFLGKRDIFRPSAYNLINKWTRAFGPRLPMEHERKRKLMGNEFLG